MICPCRSASAGSDWVVGSRNKWVEVECISQIEERRLLSTWRNWDEMLLIPCD